MTVNPILDFLTEMLTTVPDASASVVTVAGDVERPMQE